MFLPLFSVNIAPEIFRQDENHQNSVILYWLQDRNNSKKWNTGQPLKKYC